MKSAFRCFQIVLLLCGVFGADEDEVKSVSVMEGDSVTLNPDRTQIQEFNLLEWKFEDPVIAQTDGKTILYPNPTEIFRDRLQLDQTGSLTIKNMKTRHSGLYKLQISHNDGTTDRKFSVTVYESASDAGKAEMKSFLLKEGDRVTLQTDVTQLYGDELIVWRFGDEGKLIAKADIEAKSSPLYYDERFRGRLELENKTGSLIITNTRNTDSGFYAVKISSRTQTSHQKYVVTISEPGLSPGDKAGIVVGVLLFVAAAAAAAALGVIYYRRKISELRKQILTVPVSVKEGEPVTLKPNKDINKDYLIQWMFGDKKLRTRIADIRGEPRKIVINDYVADGIFRDRLKLDKTTGSLTIENTRTEHSGFYHIYIRSSRVDSQQIFILTVNETLEERSVEDGSSVTLYSGTKIQGDDQIQWMFRNQDLLIAQVIGVVEIYDAGDGWIFSDRLKLDKTGSLTIKDITAKHTGLYKLQISSSSRGTLCKNFRVFIPVRHVPMTVGKSVDLSTDLLKIETDDVIEWRFGDENSLIAEIKRGTGETYDVPDGRFRDKLQLDKRTGDLTINNSTAEHAGRYNLKIHNSEGNTNWKYIVIIRARGESMTEGNNDSSGKRGNESASVEIPLLDK